MIKIIHQHIPKTASTSVLFFFPESIRYGQDVGQTKLNQDIPEDEEVVSFTIIRNPIKRFVSCVKMFLRQGCGYSQDEVINIGLGKKFTCEEMELGRKTGYPNITKDSDRSIVNALIGVHSVSMFHPYLNVFDEDKQPKAMHLIDFDNLIRGLKKIVPDAPYKKFPKENRSVDPGVKLTDQQRERFNELFQNDILFYEAFKKSRSQGFVGSVITPFLSSLKTRLRI